MNPSRCVEHPAVWRRGAANWPVCEWTPETLADRAGDARVSVARSAHDRFDYDPRSGRTFETRTTSVRDALSSVLLAAEGGPREYLMQQPLVQVCAALLADLRVEELSPHADARGAHLWVGGPGIVTPLHYDPVHNFYVQAYGSKRVLLYDPEDLDGLYPFPMASPSPHISHVDPEAPDRARYPAFASLGAWEAVLEPGDVLVLPAFWWHHVRSVEPSISISLWSAPRLEHCMNATGWRLFRSIHELGSLGSMGAPLRGYPGGLVGASRLALRMGQPRFAALLIAAAVDAQLREMDDRERAWWQGPLALLERWQVETPPASATEDIGRWLGALTEDPSTV
ncbi:MAG: cupin-like domain-containing protein [Nannocystaceae bacterium]